MRIGDLLIKSGFLTDEELDSALKMQKQLKKTPFGQLLIMLNFLSEHELDLVLQAQRKISFASMDSELAVRALKYARQHKLNFMEASQKILLQVQESTTAQGQSTTRHSSAHPAVSVPAAQPAISQQVKAKEGAEQFLVLAQQAASQEDWLAALKNTQHACKLREEQQSNAESLLPVYCQLIELNLKVRNIEDFENALERMMNIFQQESHKLPASSFVVLSKAGCHCLSAGFLRQADEIFSAILPGWTELLPYESSKYSECLKETLSCKRKLSPFKKSNLKIGELLKSSALIDPEQFHEALQQSKKQRQPLGRVLVKSEQIELRELRNTVKVQLMCRSALIPQELAGMILKAACTTQLSSSEFFCRLQSIAASADLQMKLAADLLEKMDELILAENEKGTQDPACASLADQVGDLCLQRSELEDAEMMFRRAHAVFALAGDAYQDNLAEDCKKIGRLLIGQKKYPEAELLLLQAMEIKSRLLGEMHPELADILIDVGYLYYCQASYAAAIGFLRSAWMLQQEQTSPAAKRHVLQLLIKCFEQSGQGTEAGVYRQQLKTIDESSG